MTAAETIPGDLPDPHTTAGKIADLERRRHEAVHAGSLPAIEKQHAKGKLTARERIDLLLDEGSFVEFDELARHRAHDFGIERNRPYGDGVVTGFGTVDGRPVAVYSHDFTVFGGSLGEVYGEKIVKVMDHAMKTGCPVIGINDGGGARIQEGVVALGLFAEIFFRNARASGVIPQISLIMGPAAGGAVYSPAITDFTLMVEGTSHMFITGPDVIKTVTGEDVTLEELGGAHTHAAKSGVAHYQAPTSRTASSYVKALLSYLPSNNLDEPPVVRDRGRLRRSRPTTKSSTRSSPTRQPALRHAPGHRDRARRGDVLRGPRGLRAEHRRRLRPGRRRAGRRGRQPADALRRLPRHRRLREGGPLRPHLRRVQHPDPHLCRRPRLPARRDQEWAGIIRRGAKLLYAYAEATVPKITVITRKAYGGAYDVMGSKHLGGDVNLAWPTAQIAVMGAQGAVNILYRRELAGAEDPDALRKEKTTEYEDTLANPYIAAERGYLDAVIRPRRPGPPSPGR